MLSGNRNFEGRINPDVKMNYLASPPLCVAYALAGTMDIDIVGDPLGQDEHGEDVHLRDIWPSAHEIAQTIGEAVRADMFRHSYGEVFAGDERWNSLPVPEGERFAWDPDSTYVRLPPYFQGMPAEPAAVSDIEGARVLALLGDSVTTDHISPAGSIKRDGPAGAYLQQQGVAPRDFNSYGARRGNHEVMMRGTFANIRLRNLLGASGSDGGTPLPEGGVTRYLADGSDEQMSIYDAAMRYIQEGIDLVVLAGREYGSGSSRDWAAKGTKLLGVRAVIARELRAHPPLEPGRHGRAAAAVPRGTERAVARPHRRGDLLDDGPRRGDGRRRRAAARGAGDRRARRWPADLRSVGALRRARAHRHAARGRVLPPRRHPPVRPAGTAGRMSDKVGTPSGERPGADGVPQLLLDLLAARGPSGYESAPAAIWRSAASAFAQVSSDVVGTPLALVEPKHGYESAARRLLVMGHIDEIGLIVTHIDDEGYLWFRAIGGWDAQILVGQRVVLDTSEAR